jgi:hypothetical protein
MNLVARILIGLVTAGLLLAGTVLLAIFGGDGTVASGTQPVDSSRTALVWSVEDLADLRELGDPRLEVSASDPEVFVGIGRAADVDRYLSGVAFDEVTDFEVDPFELERQARPGARQAAPPTGETLWVAQGTGTAPLDWKIREGDYSLVLMNADGTPGVDTGVEVKLAFPHVAAIAWGLLGLGALLGVGGLVAYMRNRGDMRSDSGALAQAPSASPSTRRVSSGSITPSSQSRAVE